MRVLVTGGAGFIGHHVALRLASRGFDVVILDNLAGSTGYALSRLEEAGVPVVRGDVRFFDGYSSFDVVVHSAALVSGLDSLVRPLEYFDVNVLGTARVGLECARLGVKLIYLSSAAVYGEPLYLPVDEDHPRNPLTPYGLSKLMGEEVLELYSRVYGLKHVTLRLFNVYGPGQNPEYAGVISRFTERISRGESPVIYGDGLQTRDFIYVGDVAEIVEAFIEKDIFDGRPYNVGTEKAITILELARTLARLMGRELEPIYESPRPGDIRHSVADITRLKSQVNFEPTSLEEGLRDTLRELGVIG